MSLGYQLLFNYAPRGAAEVFFFSHFQIARFLVQIFYLVKICPFLLAPADCGKVRSLWLLQCPCTKDELSFFSQSITGGQLKGQLHLKVICWTTLGFLL